MICKAVKYSVYIQKYYITFFHIFFFLSFFLSIYNMQNAGWVNFPSRPGNSYILNLSAAVFFFCIICRTYADTSASSFAASRISCSPCFDSRPNPINLISSSFLFSSRYLLVISFEYFFKYFFAFSLLVFSYIFMAVSCFSSNVMAYSNSLSVSSAVPSIQSSIIFFTFRRSSAFICFGTKTDFPFMSISVYLAPLSAKTAGSPVAVMISLK